MGVRNLRRYAVTAERFDARRAQEFGFVHEACPTGGPDALALVIEGILHGGPAAVRRSKQPALEMSGLAIDDEPPAMAHEHATTRRRSKRKRVSGVSLRSGRPTGIRRKREQSG